MGTLETVAVKVPAVRLDEFHCIHRLIADETFDRGRPETHSSFTFSPVSLLASFFERSFISPCNQGKLKKRTKRNPILLSPRQYTDTVLMHSHLVEILDYLFLD